MLFELVLYCIRHEVPFCSVVSYHSSSLTPTIGCKNNETFHVFGHFKVSRPASLPAPHDQCWKKWVEFSLFSHSHNIDLGVRGAFMRLPQ